MMMTMMMITMIMMRSSLLAAKKGPHLQMSYKVAFLTIRFQIHLNILIIVSKSIIIIIMIIGTIINIF